MRSGHKNSFKLYLIDSISNFTYALLTFFCKILFNVKNGTSNKGSQSKTDYSTSPKREKESVCLESSPEREAEKESNDDDDSITSHPCKDKACPPHIGVKSR